MSQSSTPELMRQQNRAIVLATIQEQGPISRIELANLLGLNPATITRITRDLIEEGLVKEEGEGENKGAGRKPVLLRFNHGARLVIGIHIGSQQVTGVIADLASNILTRRTMLLAPQLTLPMLSALIDELLDDNPSYRQCLAALCVGSSTLNPITQLMAGLKQKFPVPILPLETVTLATMGEAEVGGMQEQHAFALFYLGAKSYSCLYLNGQAHVGQIGLSRDGRPLAEIICDSGLIEIFAALLADGVSSALTANTRARLIFDAARREDPAARQAVEIVVNELAFALVWTAHALNLTHIVIAGAWLTAADLLLPLVEDRLQSLTATPPVISAAKLGDESPLIGAVQMAVKMIDKTL